MGRIFHVLFETAIKYIYIQYDVCLVFYIIFCIREV